MLRATFLVLLLSFTLLQVDLLKFHFQKPGLGQSTLAATRAEDIKQKLKEAHSDYIRWGFPADEVAPLSKNGSNTLNGWGATLVDSLDTLYMMGLHDEFEDGLKKTAKIDFSRSYVNQLTSVVYTPQCQQTVSIFETTIRYLGGILTAYELTGQTRKDLLDRAHQLGNKLAYGWSNSSHPIPYGFLNFTTNKPIIDTTNIAEAGTLILEFDRLSHYTGNDTFRALADKTMKALMNLPNEFPGLPSREIYPGNSSFVGDYITWGGGIDSYFEYLLKYAMLVDNRDPRYLEEWKKAVYSSIKHLLTVSNGHTYLAAYSKSRKGLQYVVSHFECFVGGNWLLGGKFIGDETIVKYGLQLIDTCMYTYTSTETGLGPVVFRFLGPNGEVTGPNMTAQDQAFNKKHGFYISAADYLLRQVSSIKFSLKVFNTLKLIKVTICLNFRPEVLESVFYAWRMTGDERYQEFAWSTFKALNKYCKAPASYASILYVNDAKNVTQIDDSESFLFSETFKYLYLIFAPASHFSLDEYVFNTEAHPYRYNGC
ncbi:family 47 glycoside hydrolase [Melampsora larici-populina 98AG31]|uniref:alpha-1,2-Mannosidase n=1 Tax=Melampsora larici-populina (strain 98AG31 / pathotype 3-4-7) TaxID=747676 RepID=F4S651_MELLP|nr:family 47 glycoside hydrolase [Melampsora larici-populina 98AG31]EGF99902.1 family 47 glycoside hydrolase [Melampsora larici-populina 98AG31]